MPATELTEWALFYEQHPFGEFRADLRSGIVASTIAQVNGNKNAKPSDFMPLLKRERERAPSARALEAARVNAAFLKASSRLKHRVIRRNKG